MRRSLALVVFLTACVSGRGGDDAVELTTAHNSEGERRKAAQIQRLIDTYDLSKWTFTREVVVDDKARISHSHPVLTLDVGDEAYPDDVELAAYVHEQIHWLETDKAGATAAAIAELKTMYPNAPARGPEGARDLESTYLHLLVCHLEFEAMKELVGDERARAAMQKPYYRWVYRTVVADNDRLRDVVKRAGF